jgi:ribonucleoside-diphosphate reductase alpha chain
MAEIAQRGGVRGYPQLSPEVRAAFPTAAEIAPGWHRRMQAAVQRHVDAAVSKTVNLPAAATVDDVRAIYLAAWKAKVKGITVVSLRQPRRTGVDLRRAGNSAGPGHRIQRRLRGRVCEF